MRRPVSPMRLRPNTATGLAVSTGTGSSRIICSMARRPGGALDALIEAARLRRRRLSVRLLRWGRMNARSFQWREPQRSPYEVLIAELLLKRTTSTAAARLYPRFLNQFPSISAVAEAPEPYLAAALRPIGLHKQ